MSYKIEHPAHIFANVYDEVCARYGRPKDLSITSLPTLNEKIWGLRKQKLVVVAGRPSQGKSTFAGQMAWDFAKDKKKVVLFSLEMTNQVFMERLLSNYCGIDNRLLFTGEVVNEHDKYLGKINEFRSELNNTDLVLIESAGKTFEEIFNIIEGFTSPVDVVVIDYLQMIKASKGRDKRESIDEYITQLREYAIKKNFCAILVSQINRGTHDTAKIKPPSIWELKGSGAIEEVADVIFLCHYEYKYTQNELDANKYLIVVGKNRDGRTGDFNCMCKMENYKIYEAEYARADAKTNERTYRQVTGDRNEDSVF